MSVENYASYPSLVDRTVFVTGGADGIGSAVVQNFARQGSKVAFVDINPEYARQTIRPVCRSSAVSQPRTPSSPPLLPTNTRLRTMSGAIVIVSPLLM